MRRRYQGRNESIFSYFHDKVTLCKALDFDYAETKEQVVIGLFNKHIVPGLIASQADNVDDLLHEIVNFDRITEKAQHTGHHHSQRFVNKANSVENTLKTTQTQRNISVKQESPSTTTRLPERNEEGKPLCFICKQYGHVSRYCRSRTTPKCFRCKKDGHLLKDCPEPREGQKEDLPMSQSAQLVVRKENNIEEDPVEKYLREIHVKDRQLKALIDPGSAVCTIKETLVREMKLLCEPTDEILHGFGEGITISRWKTKLPVTIDNVQEEVTVLVVPDSVQPVDVMLGRSFTELPNVAYVKIGNSLYFGQEDEPPFCNLEWKNKPKKKIITAASPISLLKNHISFVQIRTEGKTSWLPMMNISKEDTRIEKAQILGELRGLTLEENIEEPEQQKEVTSITLDEVNLDKNLKPDECEQLLMLINTYRDVFATNIRELGCTDLMEVEIKDSGVPTRAKPYRTSQEDRETIREIVREWRECGIIRDTNSPYASPVLLVPKSSGEKRLVVDFRRLNSLKVRSNYPIPNIDDCLETLTGCKLFFTLDLMSGYLQVRLSEQSKAKTAFITPDETAEFERLSFGQNPKVTMKTKSGTQRRKREKR